MLGNDMNGVPGANAMGDTMAFVKNLWSSMKLPGMSVPSLSPEDIDKQIADLKAVESWLQMNMSMLRSTIQALEVQSATLNALRSMGQSFTNAAQAAAAPPPPADSRPGFDRPFDQPFESPFTQSAAAEPSPADAAADHRSTTGAGNFPDAGAMAAQFANPAAWWNTVQEQFSNAVGQALKPAAKTPRKRSATAKKSTKTTTRTTEKTAGKSGTGSPRKPRTRA